MSEYEDKVLTQFITDVRDHKMSVEHDDGVFRHLRFQKPDAWMYHFEITTWPGHLTITGDMGTFTFARLHDMFQFFNEPRINAGYWAEKLRATDTNGGHTSFSEEKFRAEVEKQLLQFKKELDDTSETRAKWADLVRDIGDDVFSESWSEGAALAAIRDWHDVSGLGFSLSADAWDWDLREYRFQFLWCLNAIRWGIQQYNAREKVDA